MRILIRPYVIRETVKNDEVLARLVAAVKACTKEHVVVLTLEQQLEAKRFFEAELEPGERILNLDRWTRTESDVKFDISRMFQADGQTETHEYTNRPGTPLLAVQLRELPAGRYVLVDDDMATGGTLEQVRYLISQYRKDITLSFTNKLLVPFSLQQLGYNSFPYDVIDLSDFTENGDGLVINGERVSYLDPRVNLNTRAKIPDPVLFRKHMTKDANG